MDVALRRMRPEDRNEVKEIEREAFAPLGVGTPFKREINNRYASYFVAFCASEARASAAPPKDDLAKDRTLWRRVADPPEHHR